MKRITLLYLFIACVTLMQAQNKALTFNQNGTFKIVQFTDIHFKPNDKSSADALNMIYETLESEQPDLVVFTGDIIGGKPASKSLDEVLGTVIDNDIPWAFVFGNHDAEYGMNKKEIMNKLSSMPNSYTENGDPNIYGVGNYVIEIFDKKNQRMQMVLYFLDSGSYSTVKGIDGYDWLSFSQIAWYRDMSEKYTSSNGGKPMPALAFFHIPLHEYTTMSLETDNIIGNKQEDEKVGELNSGMFTAMCESGDMVGVFVGHDHNNDYIGQYKGIALGYGRYSGGTNEYNDLGTNGCRVIEFKEGKRVMKTYIRLNGGEKLYNVEIKY